MWKGEIKIMGYLVRLEKARDDVAEMMKDFLFELNNKKTEAKIMKEITQIFRDNEIINDKYSTLEEAGWEVYIKESGDRFNNISVKLCVDLEMAFHFRDMTQD
jgi:hypothetical protein